MTVSTHSHTGSDGRSRDGGWQKCFGKFIGAGWIGRANSLCGNLGTWASLHGCIEDLSTLGCKGYCIGGRRDVGAWRISLGFLGWRTLCARDVFEASHDICRKSPLHTCQRKTRGIICHSASGDWQNDLQETDRRPLSLATWDYPLQSQTYYALARLSPKVASTVPDTEFPALKLPTPVVLPSGVCFCRTQISVSRKS